MSGFEVKHAYSPAKTSAGGGASGADTVIGPDDLDKNYRPNADECRVLTEPIENFLSQCTCYDMMGMSMQVVVVDVAATLAVAFIAAQETRVQSCVLWDPRKREFVGVLSSTDYIKILLYCEAHPEEAEQVSSWTIRHWREVKDTTHGPGALGDDVRMAKKARPAAIVTCTAEASLRDCLAKMKDFNVRRIIALAEKEAASFSVVAMMDVAQIVEYLGVMFFHIEKAGGSLWSHSVAKPTDREGSVSVNANNSSMTKDSASSVSGSMGPLGAPHSGGADRPGGAGGHLREPGNARRQQQQPQQQSSGAVPTSSPASIFSLGEAALPPHVSSILSAAESPEAASSDTRVGPYRSIFDIPFRNLPEGVGAHRRTPLSVTMNSALNEALKLMLRHNVESIAVCTPEMIITDVISRSDLLRMENQGVYDTSLTVREALASKISGSIFVIYEQDTVHDIFTHFVRRRVKEMFIVDPDTGRLQGQLNVSEFVFFLVFAHVAGGGGADTLTVGGRSAKKSPNQSTTSRPSPRSPTVKK